MTDALETKKKGAMVKTSFRYSIQTVYLYKNLTALKKEYIMSKQLLRLATAVGALVREAQNAESMADFIHKLNVAQKECDESLYWLELLCESNYLSQEEFICHLETAASLL